MRNSYARQRYGREVGKVQPGLWREGSPKWVGRKGVDDRGGRG